MVRIVFHRGKCIGCNGCVEAAPHRWRVSKMDGRCNLVGGIENKGIYKVLVNMEEYESNLEAANSCPVKIIQLAII